MLYVKGIGVSAPCRLVEGISELGSGGSWYSSSIG